MTLSQLIKNLVAFAAVAALAGGAYAGDAGKLVIDEKGVVEAEPWTICNVFDSNTLYENDSNPYIQKIALVGRYNGQWHHTDGEAGLESDGWEDRRWRLGTKIEFLKNFTFGMNFNVEHDSDRFFEDVEDMVIEWEAGDDFVIVVGKQKPRVTQEYSTSSKHLKTVERSQAVNQIIPNKLWGISAEKGLGAVTQELGIYQGGFDDDWAFPQWDGGIAALSRTSYELSEVTTVRLDYFYGENDPESNGVRDYDHIISLGSTNEFDGWDLTTDLIYGTGDSDLFSIVLMPSYDLTDKIELVGRYTFSTSEDDDGVRLQKRYESSAALNSRGDAYHAIYGGITYRICGDKLKLMTGVEYSTLSGGDADYDGLTYFAGVRTQF